MAATKLIKVAFRSGHANGDGDFIALIHPVTRIAFFRGEASELTKAWIYQNKCMQNLYYDVSKFPWGEITLIVQHKRLVIMNVERENMTAAACFYRRSESPFDMIRLSLEMSDAVNREFSEIQQGERLAVMMASHPRLGDVSPLGLVSIDVLALIARHIRLV
jgi:hypothetical protein